MQVIEKQIVSRGGRAIGLDLMRISMALLIFMFHSRRHILHCSYGIFNSFVEMGAIAMTGFFLLSGYVLNLTYGKKDITKVGEIKNFYLKRLISIIPLYFVWASLLTIMNVVIGGKSAAIEELVLFPVEFLGIQSVFASLLPFSHNNGSWFISCILICYFQYPLIHIITQRITHRQKVVLIIVLGVILLWSPIIRHYFHIQKIYSNPFFRSLEFTIGILVCQLNLSSAPSKFICFMRKPVICMLSLVILIVGVSLAKIMGIPGDYMLYNLIALPCFMSLMVSLGFYPFRRLQQSKVISYLSEISFCVFLGQIIYVWPAVMNALEYLGCDSNIIRILVSFMVVLGIANLLHYLVEKPSSKYLKRRFITSN